MSMPPRSLDWGWKLIGKRLREVLKLHCDPVLAYSPCPIVGFRSRSPVYPRRSFLKWVGIAGALTLGLGCRPVPKKPESHVASPTTSEEGTAQGKEISLPPPTLKGSVSLEEAIKGRRSRRSFRARPLTLSQISQLLWAAQAVTEDGGFKRAAPSAGATYPLDVYLVVGEKKVDGLQAGVYHYLVHEHALRFLTRGDIRKDLAEACLGQMFIASAPIILTITAEYARTTGRYGERGIRYVHMEVGHVGQNIYLQAEALGLGTVAIGAFYDQAVSRVLHLPGGHEPLYIMPVGYRQ